MERRGLGAHDRDMASRRGLGALFATVGTLGGIVVGATGVALADPWNDFDHILLSLVLVGLGVWIGGVVGCYAALAIIHDPSAASTAAVMAGLLPPAVALALFFAVRVVPALQGQSRGLPEVLAMIVVVGAAPLGAYLVMNGSAPSSPRTPA